MGDQFRARMTTSLAAYKRDVLGVAEDGLWRKNGQRYPHILPADHGRLNILSSIREEFWQWFNSAGFRLHSDFHHLNSSQALCFNLCFPFLAGEGQDLAKLLGALRIPGEPVAGATFEFQPDKTEGTCFDFMIPTLSGARVYFETKYTEQDFGRARADARHVDKFERVYRPRLAGKFEGSFCHAERFLTNYQICRNVWHLNGASDDAVVFLFPSANSSLRQREEIIRTCAVEPFRSRIHIAYLEDLLVSLLRDRRSTGREITALTEFQAKYFPVPGSDNSCRHFGTARQRQGDWVELGPPRTGRRWR